MTLTVSLFFCECLWVSVSDCETECAWDRVCVSHSLTHTTPMNVSVRLTDSKQTNKQSSKQTNNHSASFQWFYLHHHHHHHHHFHHHDIIIIIPDTYSTPQLTVPMYLPIKRINIFIFHQVATLFPFHQLLFFRFIYCSFSVFDRSQTLLRFQRFPDFD